MAMRVRRSTLAVGAAAPLWLVACSPSTPAAAPLTPTPFSTPASSGLRLSLEQRLDHDKLVIDDDIVVWYSPCIFSQAGGYYLSSIVVYHLPSGSALPLNTDGTPSTTEIVRLENGREVITVADNAPRFLTSEGEARLTALFQNEETMRRIVSNYEKSVRCPPETLLPTGMVSSTEIYLPDDGTFSRSGELTAHRRHHGGTLLPDGRVLISGGRNDDVGNLASTELYDPRLGLFSPGGSLTLARRQHTATLLPDGTVLIVGGSGPESSDPVASAELYDPEEGTSAPTGHMGLARKGHTATLLNDGTVLIVGGWEEGEGGRILATAEIYDPSTGLFSPVGPMVTPRLVHTASLLLDGRVLIAGGSAPQPVSSTAAAELYDPRTRSFMPAANMHVRRSQHTATVLPDGRVLIAGGRIQGEGDLAAAELYDPETDQFVRVGDMAVARSHHNATLLDDGGVLITGGSDKAGPIFDFEIFDPASGQFDIRGKSIVNRVDHSATRLADGKVLVVGGYSQPRRP